MLEPDLLPTTLSTLGRYTVLGEISRGAMGIVYKAFDPVIERMVAIKTVRKDKAMLADGGEVQLARFKREAEAAGRLTHPNIVAIYEYGDLDDTAFIAMEFIDGSTLKDYLDDEYPFSMDEIARIMGQLLGALGYSHRFGIVHRDIKPANLMLNRAGDLKITDFGIARIESSELTVVGTVLGTPSYMSPEQFRGEAADQRADLFSAGAVLYELLTGRRPFSGPIRTVEHMILHVDAERPSAVRPTVPSAFDDVIARALAKRPDQRFQTAEQMSRAIRAVIEQPATTTLARDRLCDADETLIGETTARLPAGPGGPAGAPPVAGPPAAASRPESADRGGAEPDDGAISFTDAFGDSRPARAGARSQARATEEPSAPSQAPAPREAPVPGEPGSAARPPLPVEPERAVEPSLSAGPSRRAKPSGADGKLAAPVPGRAGPARRQGGLIAALGVLAIAAGGAAIWLTAAPPARRPQLAIEIPTTAEPRLAPATQPAPALPAAAPPLAPPPATVSALPETLARRPDPRPEPAPPPVVAESAPAPVAVPVPASAPPIEAPPPTPAASPTPASPPRAPPPVTAASAELTPTTVPAVVPAGPAPVPAAAPPIAERPPTPAPIPPAAQAPALVQAQTPAQAPALVQTPASQGSTLPQATAMVHPPALVHVPGLPSPPQQPVPEPQVALAVPALDKIRSALDRLPCALFTVGLGPAGEIAASGWVGHDSSGTEARRAVQQAAGNRGAKVSVGSITDKLCPALAATVGLRDRNGDPQTGLALTTADSDGIFRGGQNLVISVRGADFDGHLLVDYFTLEGYVVHLLPNPLDVDDRIARGGTRVLGDASAGGRFWVVGAPFGKELIVAIASPTQVFDSARAEIEPAERYLADLEAAIARRASRPPAVAAAIVITSTPK